MPPQTQRTWVLKGRGGLHNVKLVEDAPIPQIGVNEVLVRFKAASLNYRDLLVLQSGDKVMPTFSQAHLAGTAGDKSLGGPSDEYGSFNEETLVRVPNGYDFVQAATLPCAAVTAWKALYGLESRGLRPGDWVLIQGNGGVSIFALQFARAAGARVVATSSSEEKMKRLCELGAEHVINYREDKDRGETARQLTGGLGFNHIVDVGGTGTLTQSLDAVRIEGVISVVGFLGKGDSMPTLLDVLSHKCIFRGVSVGTRAHFEEMVRFIGMNSIKPTVNERVFDINEVKEAYAYLEGQKHYGKVCFRLD